MYVMCAAAGGVLYRKQCHGDKGGRWFNERVGGPGAKTTNIHKNESRLREVERESERRKELYVYRCLMYCVS